MNMNTTESFNLEEVMFNLAPVKLVIEGMLNAEQGGVSVEPLTRLELASLHNSLSKAYYMLEQKLPDYLPTTAENLPQLTN